MPNLKILEDLLQKEVPEDLSFLFNSITNEISQYLNFSPYYYNVKVKISKSIEGSNFEEDNFFNIGVNRIVQKDTYLILIDEKYIKFISFIILREIYYIFVPPELRSYEIIHIVINQIIMNDLKNSVYLNKWRALIRSKIENYDLLSRGFNRLSAFDRLEDFFKLQTTENQNNPTQFFFYYLRRNLTLINNNISDIHKQIFFEEYSNFISKSMKNDDIIETIRCVIEIFYKVKSYQNLLNYKKNFQEFKEEGQLTTNLSSRKFVSNIRWIKNYSYIAPSYQLNWNAINVGVIMIFLRFNPLLNKTKVKKIIKNLPFFISPKITRNSFTFDLCGYVILPKVYLRDFSRFIEKLVDFGYIILHHILLRTFVSHINNLNYLREYSQNKRFINPKSQKYDKRYEIEFQMDFGDKFYVKELSLLDFLILDRIRFFSISGFGFERRRDVLKTLKSDLINEIITERSKINNIKDVLDVFHKSSDLKADLLQFLDLNKKFGFFTMKELLEENLELLNLMEGIIKNNPNIKNLTEFSKIVNSKYNSIVIEHNILLNKSNLKNVLLKDFISIYFQSKKLYGKKLKKFRNYYDLFKACYDLKIFDFNIIKKILIDEELIDTILKTKGNNLKNYFEMDKVYEISSQELNNKLDKFLNNTPPLIKPLLINTILLDMLVNDFIEILLIDCQETQKILEIIKKYFPMILINHGKNVFSKEKLLYIEISTPSLTKEEKLELFSVLFNKFKNNIVYGKYYIWRGIIPGFSSKNFYDFDKKEYFYTKGLFEQYFIYAENMLGKPLKIINENPYKNQACFWSKEENIDNLISSVERYDYLKKEELNITELKALIHFDFALNQYLLDINSYKNVKEESFFKNYINSIKFIPAFQNFGFGQFYLYIYPLDMNEIDFKQLLINNFQKVKYPASISNSNSFFIKYLFPKHNPNMSYLNWLTKSRKVIREYSMFFIKNIFNIFHVNFNLSSTGWNYSSERFKMHMQNILFNPDYEIKMPEVKKYNISDTSDKIFFRPDSCEFESLSQIYNWHSLDIKSYLGTKKSTIINNISELLSKNLIFPYLSFKNLALNDKLYIIIPNTTPELNKTLIKIFYYFNLSHIYEIEGEFFIYGFDKEVKFENGLFIKLYFPKCEISEFFRIFDLLFEYLEIDHYLILHDLVSGNNLLESVFGNLDFLERYNPLKNLEWDENHNIWLNQGVFTSKFEPKYPNLVED
jgi:hypothetical protein